LQSLDTDLDADAARFKSDWFAFNGGARKPSNAGFKKPLFFDIALNYVQLDMERLEARADRAPVAKTQQPARAEPAQEKKVQQPQRAKVEEISRTATPEPAAAPARGGLGSLLGGWWGKQ
jgi:signal recognition particle subunit SRP68